MKKLILLLLVIFLFPSVYAKPKCKKSKPTCGATSISSGDCPKEGCGGDAELNRRKNIVTAAASPETYTRSDFVKLKFPAHWTSGGKRKLLKNWGEGSPVVYEAYLLKVKNYACGMELPG